MSEIRDERFTFVALDDFASERLNSPKLFLLEECI